MQTFQDVGLKCDSSITIPKQKITQTESTTEVRKTQIKRNFFFFKAKEIYIWVLLIYPGKGPCLLTGLQAVFLIFCPHLNSLVRFSQLHGTSY